MLEQTTNSSTDRLEIVATLRSAVEPMMSITGYSFDPDGTVHLRGSLKMPSDQVYHPLREKVEQAGFTAYLKEKDGKYELVAVPGVIPRTKSNPQVNLWLFIATVVSVVYTGAVLARSEIDPDWGGGILFAATLLAILVTHEMGHYVVGRLRGAPVSLPYFIPLPLPGTFGTMGAVIVQREPFEDRRTLLEVGIAGPLAGFIVAIPLLVIGLTLCKVQPLPPEAVGGMMTFGDSLLTNFLSTLFFGVVPAGYAVMAHPVFIAAWFGLLVTAINLVPAGQLDGGHVAYAILGLRAKYLSYVMIAAFFILAMALSTSWLLWAFLLLLFGRSHPPALNQALKLEPIHIVLGIAALLVLVLVFVPNPISIS